MATINDFKREISELVKAQKVAKRINHQSEVYRNGGVRSHISNAAKHKTKTAYGYRWEYAQ